MVGGSPESRGACQRRRPRAWVAGCDRARPLPVRMERCRVGSSRAQMAVRWHSRAVSRPEGWASAFGDQPAGSADAQARALVRATSPPLLILRRHHGLRYRDRSEPRCRRVVPMRLAGRWDRRVRTGSRHPKATSCGWALSWALETPSTVIESCGFRWIVALPSSPIVVWERTPARLRYRVAERSMMS